MQQSRYLEAGYVPSERFATSGLGEDREPERDKEENGGEENHRPPSPSIRIANWPNLFEANGNIRTDREPEDPAPLIWCHGLPGPQYIATITSSAVVKPQTDLLSEREHRVLNDGETNNNSLIAMV